MTIRVGTPDVDPGLPSHVEGVKQGNAKGNYESQAGHNADGTATAERSTGIRPERHGPIDPRMPNIPPG
jgi:hypothetical protein